MKKIISILMFLILASCATIDSLEKGSGTTFKITGKDYATIWRVANSNVAKQLTIVSSEKEKGIIKAEKGAGLSTWGEVVGVFITPQTPTEKEYEIEVLSLKRSRMQITGQDWTQTIILGMKSDLGID